MEWAVEHRLVVGHQTDGPGDRRRGIEDAAANEDR